MRVGVLGATGMLGHNTARALLEMGHRLVVLRREGSNLERLGELEFESRIADINQPDSLVDAFHELDAVVHSAAHYPTLPRPWQEDVAIAKAQMAGFLKAVDATGLARAVYVGGAIAIPRRGDGQPADESGEYASSPANRNPYVQCKYWMDRMAREAGRKGLPVSVAIPSMTFGEFDWGPSTGQLVVGVANGQIRKYIAGQRNVIAAADAGRGIARVLEAGRSGQRYLLTGHNTDMDELVAMIAELAGVAPPGRAPLAVARFMSALQSWRFRRLGGPLPRISATAIAIMSAGQHLDGALARDELGFEARISLQDTLQRAFEWLREHHFETTTTS